MKGDNVTGYKNTQEDFERLFSEDSFLHCNMLQFSEPFQKC